MVKKIIMLVFLGVVLAGGAEIKLPADELLQGTPANGIYQTHWVITDPNGTRLIGEYPLREYPLELIYGEGKGIIPVQLHRPDCLKWAEEHFDYFQARRVRVILLFSEFYEKAYIPTKDIWGVYRYRYSDPDRIDRFITLAHNRGFMVACYLRSPAKDVWHGQSLGNTFRSLETLVYKHRLDAVYGDGFNCGTVLDSLRFVRALRRVVDDSARRNGFNRGWIMMHGSYSIAGRKERQILPDIVIRQECDLFLSGESLQPGGVPKSLHSKYMQDFHDTRGRSNVPWSYKWKKGLSRVYPGDTLSEKEVAKMIAAGDGYLKLTRYNQPAFEVYWSEYQKKRNQYLANPRE